MLLRQHIAQVGASFGGQLLFTFSSTFFIFGLGMLTSIFTARLLGPTGRGELAAIQLWGPFFGGLAVAGIPEAVVYFVGKKPSEAGSYLVTGIILAAVTGIPVTLAAFVLIPYLLPAQSADVVTMARWYALILALLFAVNMVSTSVLRGIQQFAVWSLLRPLGTFGWLAIIIVAFLTQNATVAFLSVGFLLANAVASLFAVVVTFRHATGPYRLRFNYWPPLFRFGLPTALSLLPTYLIYYGRLSQMFVAAMLAPEALGLIVVAINWSNIVSLVPQSIGPVIFPRVSALTQNELQSREISRGTRLTTLLSAVASLLFIVISPFVIPLIYGADFEPAVLPAIIMLVTAVPAALRKVAGDALRGLNRPQMALLGEIVSLETALLLLLLLIQPLGITGAALALLLSEVVSAGIILLLLTRAAQVSLFKLLIPTAQDVRTIRVFAARVGRPAA